MKKHSFFVCLISCLWMSGLLSQQVVAQENHPNPFGHALVPDMIADASITEFDGTFYCYATTDGYGRGLDTSGPPVVWKSRDFVNWWFDGTYFPSAVKEKYWAPSKAIAANGKYYIYPTVNGIMHVGVADSPDGPFRLARGEDVFRKPYAPEGTLLTDGERWGIDAEVFIDDDGQAYVFWGRRNVAKLKPDMITIDGKIQIISTPQKAYSEGPIFFKRKGIYYYLYTIGGNEKYQYYYGMSKTSPMGPYEFPEQDLLTTTNVETGVYGPGHGCVFQLEGTDDFYFAYLEFGRRSTNRQTYVNRMEFNEDGTIKPVDVHLNGVGVLREVKTDKPLEIKSLQASSVRKPMPIKPISDPTCLRTEYFDVAFAADGANGSRWMPDEIEGDCWIMADLGRKRKINRSELFFVRPTAEHAYILEASADGEKWDTIAFHNTTEMKSPQTDEVKGRYRYLRVKMMRGEFGLWEWKIY